MINLKEHVWIPSRSKRLSAMVHIPDTFHNKTPLIICCHGFTGDKVGYNQLTVNLANVLENAGYAVIRFDYLGSGDSDGNFANDTSVAGWKEDLNNVLAWINSQPRFSKNPRLLYGHSLGGLVVLTHQDDCRQIAARMVFAPVTSPISNFQEIIFGSDLWQKALAGEQIGYFYGKGFKLNSQFVADLVANDYNPREIMAQVITPLLMVHGFLDAVVPIQGSKNFFQTYQGEKEFKELELEHSAENNQEILQAAILEWLTAYFPS